MFAVVIAVLCLVSVSLSAPLSCEDLIQPLDQLDPRNLDGRWALVAGSLEDPRAEAGLRIRDSTTIYASNFTYTQVDRYGSKCLEGHLNVSVERPTFNFTMFNVNFSGIFIRTSCPDCVVFVFDVSTHRYSRRDLYLFSKRRELGHSEMKEFRAQVQCFNLPPPLVPDPAKELCPRETEIKPEAHGEEKAEGQKA